MEQKTGRGPIAPTLLLVGILLAVVGLFGSLLGNRPQFEEALPAESLSLELPGLTGIDLDTAFGDVEFVLQGDRSYLSGSGFEKGTVTSRYENGRLVMRQKTPGRMLTDRLKDLLRGRGSPLRRGKLVITIAEGTRLEKLDVEHGAGNLSLRGVVADKAEIGLGAGEITLEGTALSEALVEDGAGNITLKNVSIPNKLTVENGTGNILLEGSVAGKIKLSCGAGNITANLSGSLQDYRITASCGLGEVRVGGFGYGKKAELSPSGALHSIEAENGAGNVDISIQ